MAGIIVSSLTPEQCPSVAAVVNEAFLVDAFFKKDEFKNRIDDMGTRLLEMIAPPGHAILVAADAVSGQVVGAVHVHWHTDGAHPLGSFGMLAVSKARERGGIGKALVRAAGI